MATLSFSLSFFLSLSQCLYALSPSQYLDRKQIVLVAINYRPSALCSLTIFACNIHTDEHTLTTLLLFTPPTFSLSLSFFHQGMYIVWQNVFSYASRSCARARAFARSRLRDFFLSSILGRQLFDLPVSIDCLLACVRLPCFAPRWLLSLLGETHSLTLANHTV